MKSQEIRVTKTHICSNKTLYSSGWSRGAKNGRQLFKILQINMPPP